MAITYPLRMPAPGVASLKVTQSNQVAMAQSQFTGAQQVQEWPGEWWEAEFSLPYLMPDQARQWRAFLAALRGQSGTFLMGPEGLTIPSGAASGYTNLLRWTETFQNSVWVKQSSFGPAPVVTPDTQPAGNTGLPSTDKVVFPTTSTNQVADIYQYANVFPAGQFFAASVFACADPGQTVTLDLYIDAGSGVGGINIYEIYSQTMVINSTTPTRFVFTCQFSSSVIGPVRFGIRQQPNQAAQTVYLYAAMLERLTDPDSISDYYGECNPAGVSTIGGSKTLTIGGWTSYNNAMIGQTMLQAGDWFQIANHLYLALSDFTVQSNQSATGDIYPRLRNDAVSGSPVYYIDPVGTWRLSENPRSWQLQPGANGPITDISGIKCREALP